MGCGSSTQEAEPKPSQSTAAASSKPRSDQPADTSHTTKSTHPDAASQPQSEKTREAESAGTVAAQRQSSSPPPQPATKGTTPYESTTLTPPPPATPPSSSSNSQPATTPTAPPPPIIAGGLPVVTVLDDHGFTVKTTITSRTKVVYIASWIDHAVSCRQRAQQQQYPPPSVAFSSPAADPITDSDSQSKRSVESAFLASASRTSSPSPHMTSPQTPSVVHTYTLLLASPTKTGAAGNGGGGSLSASRPPLPVGHPMRLAWPDPQLDASKLRAQVKAAKAAAAHTASPPSNDHAKVSAHQPAAPPELSRSQTPGGQEAPPAVVQPHVLVAGTQPPPAAAASSSGSGNGAGPTTWVIRVAPETQSNGATGSMAVHRNVQESTRQRGGTGRGDSSSMSMSSGMTSHGTLTVTAGLGPSVVTPTHSRRASGQHAGPFIPESGGGGEDGAMNLPPQAVGPTTTSTQGNLSSQQLVPITTPAAHAHSEDNHPPLPRNETVPPDQLDEILNQMLGGPASTAPGKR